MGDRGRPGSGPHSPKPPHEPVAPGPAGAPYTGHGARGDGARGHHGSRPAQGPGPGAPGGAASDQNPGAVPTGPRRDVWSPERGAAGAGPHTGLPRGARPPPRPRPRTRRVAASRKRRRWAATERPPHPTKSPPTRRPGLPGGTALRPRRTSTRPHPWDPRGPGFRPAPRGRPLRSTTRRISPRGPARAP